MHVANLKSIWDQSEIELGSSQDQFGIDLELIQNGLWINSGSSWDQFSFKLGSIQNQRGIAS